MSENEIENLRNDVAKTGYLTEMVAASIFGGAGWETYDHFYYLDKDENKGREIDLLAAYYQSQKNEKKSVSVNIGLSVEVKKVTNKPWVIFTSPLTKYEAVENLFDTSLIRLHQQEIWFKDLYANHPITNWKQFGRVSYQAFRKEQQNQELIIDSKAIAPKRQRQADQDITPNFSAFVSAFKAASEIAAVFRQKSNAPLRDNKGIKTYEVGIVHGLIIIDGKLYQSIVKNDKSFDIEESKYIPYIFNYNSKEYSARRLLVDIVTLSYLKEYLSIYQKWIEDRADYCFKELS